MIRYLFAVVLFLICIACESSIPISGVEGSLVPAASIIPEVQLPQGHLSSQINGPNTPISGANIPDAAEKLVSMLRMNMKKGLTLDTVTGVYDGVFEQLNFGDAILTGVFDATIDDQNQYTFRGNYTAELNDWTGDSEQYFGGGLAYEMTAGSTLGAMDSGGSEASVSGRVALGGTYSGAISFKDFYILMGSGFGSYNGNIQVEVNGVKTIYYLAETK